MKLAPAQAGSTVGTLLNVAFGSRDVVHDADEETKVGVSPHVTSLVSNLQPGNNVQVEGRQSLRATVWSNVRRTSQHVDPAVLVVERVDR